MFNTRCTDTMHHRHAHLSVLIAVSRHPDHFAMKLSRRSTVATKATPQRRLSTTADTARTLLAVTDRPFGSIATNFEKFMPRGWSFAARGIVGEVRRL